MSSTRLDDDLMMRLLLEQEGNDGRSLVHLDSYDSHDQLEKYALPGGMDGLQGPERRSILL